MVHNDWMAVTESAEEYLTRLVSSYTVVGSSILVDQLSRSLSLAIQQWAGIYLVEVYFSGSFVKGTAIKGRSDRDLFISLRNDIPLTIRDTFYSLVSHLRNASYNPKLQDVSIGVEYNGMHIDLIPAIRQHGFQDYHSLHRRVSDSWVQTNVKAHINLIRNSGRINEIKLTKIWRQNHDIHFPSFYLELIVLEALKRRSFNNLADNFFTVLQYLRDYFVYARVQDPSNTNNIVSDDLNTSEKDIIRNHATSSITQQYWNDIAW
jgi:hypothetical protein